MIGIKYLFNYTTIALSKSQNNNDKMNKKMLKVRVISMKSSFDFILGHGSMIFYYIIAEIAIIRKMIILINPAIGLILSICIAIYLTSLFH